MSDDNVIELDLITSLDIPPERVLKRALEASLTSALVLGYKDDGTFYFATSAASGPENLWLLERARHCLMLLADGDGDGIDRH